MSNYIPVNASYNMIVPKLHPDTGEVIEWNEEPVVAWWTFTNPPTPVGLVTGTTSHQAARDKILIRYPNGRIKHPQLPDRSYDDPRDCYEVMGLLPKQD